MFKRYHHKRQTRVTVREKEEVNGPRISSGRPGW